MLACGLSHDSHVIYVRSTRGLGRTSRGTWTSPKSKQSLLCHSTGDIVRYWLFIKSAYNMPITVSIVQYSQFIHKQHIICWTLCDSTDSIFLCVVNWNSTDLQLLHCNWIWPLTNVKERQCFTHQTYLLDHKTITFSLYDSELNCFRISRVYRTS